MPGEIHAVLGENGAGKSTLMKIAYGAVQPDEGEIRWEGRAGRDRDPQAARALGIGMVFQHFALFDSLTAAENVWLGLDKTRARRVTARHPRQGRRVRPRASTRSGRSTRFRSASASGSRSSARCSRAAAADHGRTDIGADAAGRREAVRDAAAPRRARLSILYISHKLDEVRALCIARTVLRGGRITGAAIRAHETVASLSRMMIGAEPPQLALATGPARRAGARGARALARAAATSSASRSTASTSGRTRRDGRDRRRLGKRPARTAGRDVGEDRRAPPGSVLLAGAPRRRCSAGAPRTGPALCSRGATRTRRRPALGLDHNLLLTRARAGAGRRLADPRRCGDDPRASSSASTSRRAAPRRGAQPVWRQPAEVHRRARDGRRGRSCWSSRSRPGAWTSARRRRSEGAARAPRCRRRCWWSARNSTSCSRSRDRLFVIAGGRLSAPIASSTPTRSGSGTDERLVGGRAGHGAACSGRWPMLRLEARPPPSRAMSLASPLFALALTVAVRRDPVRRAREGSAARPQHVLREPLRTVRGLTEIALKTTPLVLCALGLAICYRANVWNIGAEGQFLPGGIAAGGVALYVTTHGIAAPHGAMTPVVLTAGSWAAWRGRRSPRCCGIASTRTRSWSA